MSDQTPLSPPVPLLMPGSVAPAAQAVASAPVRVVAESESRERSDWVVIEEPLEIRAGGPDQEPLSVAVTMRTPGHDFELAVGFLRTEGLIESPEELKATTDPATPRNSLLPARVCNVVHVALRVPFDGSSLKRNFFATSSCGVCGKATLDQVAVRCEGVGEGPVVPRSTIIALPDRLRHGQAVFERTGGLHAAGLFDAQGRLLILREDVGRHNAVDKLIGRAFLDGGLPLADRILMVSGRTSFEILQKAAVAGIAVSAPSSLAISLADRLGMTLVGFLRGSGFNIYTHPGRIDPHR